MISPRDLLKGLLDYIEAQAKEIDPKGYRIAAAKEFVQRNTELAGLPGIEFDLRPEGDHIWLRLVRLEAHRPPPVADTFKGLFKVSTNPFGAPPALDEGHLVTWIAQCESKSDPLLAKSYEAKLRQLQLRQKAQVALQEYLPQWKAWVESEQPRRRSITLYGELFALKHQLEAEETVQPQELVWGLGVTSWQIPCAASSVNFEYPLLTQTVEIAIDESSMALEIRPRATDTRVEMEAFVACSVPGAADVEQAIKAHLQEHKDRPVTPFDAASYTDVLKLAASNLDSNGSYREQLSKDDPLAASATGLLVTDAWVLLSRPRTTHYLTDDLKRLRDKLDSGCAIPAGPLALVTPPADQSKEFESIRFRGLSSRGASHGKSAELYFPLPYNEEQVTIIQRLETAAGVAVQGPPGTGKTHTIANVICHYLATGRRVLVTSRGEPALAVLQSKIPEAVRPLTVALMASDRDGVRQFQASIQAIQYQVSQLNPEQTRQELATLETVLNRAHDELAAIDQRIDVIAHAQLAEVDVEGVPMRAQQLAELVISGAQQHGWFDDDMTLAAENAPPLTDEEAGKLHAARRNVGQDLVYLQVGYPAVDALPGPPAIAALHDALCGIRIIEAEIARGELLELKAASAEVLSAANELLELVEAVKTMVEELEAADGGWPLELRVKCRLSSFVSERQALESLFSDIDALVAVRAAFLKRPVDFPEAGLRTAKTQAAVARAVATGKPFGMMTFGAGAAKQHIAAVKVSGLPPASIDDWTHVQRHVGLHVQVASFVSRWNQFADELSIPRLEGGVAVLRRIELIATSAKKAHRLATQFDSALAKAAAAVFGSPPTQALLGGSAELHEVKTQLQRHLTKAELSKAATPLHSLQEQLVGTRGPVGSALQQFVEQQLGNPDLPAARVVTHYAELLAELRRISALTPEFTCIKELAARIEQAGAPKLASRIRSRPLEKSGDDSAFPVTWRQAWNWARVRTHLDMIEAREELLTLSARRQELERGLARRYQELVAKAAWLATKCNATPKVLQALAGYATAIRRIGQGTGPNATRYRRDAREMMLDAAGAVPCWIMSHARISEAMPADIGAFDLVIVDEASQSDLWALPAILRGKKILVVGDDKQVSPDGGFISGQRIQELEVRFLSKQPYGKEMTPEKSLYDLAARVFAAEQVMLREHFRCVPPIIAYSNQVFYKGGIQPLRIPKASERIDPPLVDIYVPDGRRAKDEHNDAEAQAIAAEIAVILNNAALAGRTLGVVSLLGTEQAKHIDAVVRQRCNAAELLQRKFECGDARTFQGSERDIMFLSMVVDRNNCHPLSGLKYDQRFNVAASRARDRMYLVRSVQAADLSDKDLRLSLLSHFHAPAVTDTDALGSLLDQCESSFERDMFALLSARGYRVIPQVKTGAYRIDMVIEGAGDSRLALELDGDEYHGPDRWPQDMNHQRVLERAGWVFWRCFASTWTLRKDAVLAELLARLTAMGIEPMGAMAHAPSMVEKRTWQPLPADADEPSIDETQTGLEPAIAGGE